MMNHLGRLLLSAFLAALFAAPTVRTAGENDYWMYVGTYTKGASKGIYAFRFQPSTGQAVPAGLAAEAINPSFLVVHPNGRFLYAANEVSNYDGKNGYVSAFSIDFKTGQLTFLNKVSSGGSDPCHITIDKSGKWLMVANYTSGSVSVLQIESDGKLGKTTARVQHSTSSRLPVQWPGAGPNPQRQEGPHAHSVNLSPDNRFLFVSDLGLDMVMVYRFDPDAGTLKLNDPPSPILKPGTGPRHLAFHPNGRWVYLINELNSTVTALTFDPGRGMLNPFEIVSTLPPDFAGFNTTAEIAVSPDGRFVYGSNRGHNSIAFFAVTGNEGMLEYHGWFSTAGKTPRHFALDPSGNYLFAANQDSDDVVMFRIDRKTGELAYTETVLRVPMPVCVAFSPEKP
jgi:6-phosphogluconolactonase